MTFKFVFVLLLTAAVGSANAQNVFKCVGENGQIQFSDRPCSDDQTEELVETLDRPRQESKVELDADAPLEDLIVGRWSWDEGDSIREFKADGSFSSRGSDAWGRTTIEGKWSIKGKILRISATYYNVRNNGERYSISDSSSDRIVSLDNKKLTLVTTDSDWKSEWTKR